MKKIHKRINQAIIAIGAVAVAGAANATALVDVSSFAVDTASVGTVGGVVVAGLGLMWGLRKLVKTINRT